MTSEKLTWIWSMRLLQLLQLTRCATVRKGRNTLSMIALKEAAEGGLDPNESVCSPRIDAVACCFFSDLFALPALGLWTTKSAQGAIGRRSFGAIFHFIGVCGGSDRNQEPQAAEQKYH